MELVFFKNRDFNITINSIEDAKRVKKIGVTKRVANHEILKSLGFTNLDVISGSDDKNIKKLLKKRIDLWPGNKAAVLYSAKKLGVDEEIVAIPNVVLAKGDLFIAFNKNIDDKIVKKWQNALDRLYAKGVIDKIKSKY
jgi:polar amino acid transport system substrate-binding protein